jgi:hypothetical protein
MKKTVLVLVSLLIFAAAYAQDDMSTMTGGMTGGDMMMGEMTGGDMMMGDMTGGGMTGGAMMRQSTEVTLSGDQEVPAVMTDAMGSATVTLSGMTLSLQGEFSGLSSPAVEIAGTPGHIHMAPMGENGGVIYPLNVSVAEDGMSGIFSLETELSDEELEAFMAGELYLNFHTEMHEGGELRGQIVPSMGM